MFSPSVVRGKVYGGRIHRMLRQEQKAV